VFGASVEEVYLDVFVTERGRGIPGLGAGDFLVKDNGVVQEPRLVDLDVVGVTAVLLLDTSSSMAGEKLGGLKRAAQALVAGLSERDEAALVSFAHDVRLRHPPTADRQALHAAIEGLVASGATSLRDALYLCLKRQWGSGRPLLVVFTDGEDQTSWLEAEASSGAALASPALIEVVGLARPMPTEIVGRRRREAYEPEHVAWLRRVAESTGGSYRDVESGTRLESAFLSILQAMKTRYLLGYTPRGVAEGGKHRLSVEVKGRRLDVRARQEYVR
jgi:VWFA-related protein